MLCAPIETPRLILRNLALQDASEAYLAWLSEPLVNRYLEIRFYPQTIATLEAFISDMNDSKDNVLFGICIRETGEHVGNIKLGPINDHHRRADIGLLIGSAAHWGKGYATEAIAAITDVALTTLGLHKVTAGCYARNEGSRRAFLRAGFAEVGRLRQHWDTDEGWDDEVLLEYLRP